MDEALAKRIAELVIDSTKYWTAIFSMTGVIVGAFISTLGSIVKDWLKSRRKAKEDQPAKDLLLTMLRDRKYENGWRNFSTLRHVIGADAKTTRRLLREIGARASEDGQDKWGLLEYHPLEEAKRKLLQK